MTEDKNKISIAECRRILGKKYEKCTDEQILAIRELLYDFAELDVKRLLENRNTKKRIKE
jgi:hypothetical protein